MEKKQLFSIHLNCKTLHCTQHNHVDNAAFNAFTALG